MNKQSNPQIILGSSSRYRRALLERLGLEFSCISPDIDESALESESPAKLVARLAVEKAKAVAGQSSSSALIIGSDQLAVCGDTILGKPGNFENAVQQLSSCSGQHVSFLTSLCLYQEESALELTATIPINVQFRKLSQAEIERYLLKDTPYDCAGSFKSESLGVALFDKVETQDLTALEGLPLITLCKFLRQAGLQIP
ncbi:MAG: septum formation protein [Pseudoalteromonas tetraodonis]|jgi:septum formation protein